MEIDLKQLRELMRALKQFDVNELEIERGDERIFLKRGVDPAPAAYATFASPSMAPAPMSAPAPSGAGGQSAAGTSSSDVATDVVLVTSPFVGTFYRAASPDSDSFVEVGQTIRAGQVLCIVEAMKLMNEIESEVAGTIVEALVENGKPVEYGDALFKVKKS